MIEEHTEDGQLTDRQKLFVEAYLLTLNGAQAARLAYNVTNGSSASSMAHKVRSLPHVRAAIEEGLAARSMGAHELMAHMSRMISFDIGDILDDEGNIDLALAKQQGLTWAIKGITQETTRFGKRTRVELHDSLTAARSVMKPLGLDRQIVQVESEDKLAELLRGMTAPWAKRDGEER